VPPPEAKPTRENVSKATFAYDAAADTYRCPQGRSCAGPARRPRASSITTTPAPVGCLSEPMHHGRVSMMARQANEAAMKPTASGSRTTRKSWPSAKHRRTCLWHAAHVGHDEFLMRGLKNVRAEWSLSALVYNLRRVLEHRQHGKTAQNSPRRVKGGRSPGFSQRAN